MRRTRQRPLPVPRDRAGARAPIRLRPRRDRLLLPRRRGQRPGRRAGAVGDRLLRLRVHDVAEAHDGAEHRDRRRGRRRARARRMGRRHRDARLAGRRAVRDRVRLDAAALLGAGDALLGRLRGGRRPDAPGGPRRGRDPAADPPVFARAVRDDAAARPRGTHGTRVHGRGRRCSAARSSIARCRCGGPATTPGRGACSRSRSCTSPGCSARSASTRSSSSEPPQARRSSIRPVELPLVGRAEHDPSDRALPIDDVGVGQGRETRGRPRSGPTGRKRLGYGTLELLDPARGRRRDRPGS